MKGWVYIIRNGDLYKIGITQNIRRRMKQLRPDEIISSLKTNNYIILEKKLHKLFKSKRIPQTEYFRLSHNEVKTCKKELSTNYLSKLSETIEFITGNKICPCRFLSIHS